MEAAPQPKPGIMSYEEYAKLRHETPYIYSVEAGEKRLTYFGARHTFDPADSQLAEIEHGFVTAQPEIVLVEGVSALAARWEKGAPKLREQSREEAARTWGETGFALKLAADAGVLADSPEPELRDEIANAEAQGVTREALFAYYGYRGVDQYHRTEKVAPIEEYLADHLAGLAVASGWEGYDFSAANLERVGRSFWGDRASFAVADDERVDPVPWEPGERLWTDVNRASQASSRFRDEFIVGQIAEAMKKFDRVFVVFGASHAAMQEAAVRAAAESAA